MTPLTLAVAGLSVVVAGGFYTLGNWFDALIKTIRVSNDLNSEILRLLKHNEPRLNEGMALHRKSVDISERSLRLNEQLAHRAMVQS